MNSSSDSLAPRHVRRATWVVVLVWTLAGAVSMVWNWRLLRDAMLEAATMDARNHFDKDVLYRRWATLHGGVYAPVTALTPPNPYLTNAVERDLVTPSGRRLTLMNPSYMTRQVHELEAPETGTHGHLTSLKPLRPENAPDTWEAAALRAFEQGRTEVSSRERLHGQPYLRLMKPLVTEAACLECHAAQGYHEGDIRGGISIAVPLAPYLASAQPRTRNLAGIHAGLWVLGALGILLGGRQIRRGLDERLRAELAIQRQAAFARFNPNPVLELSAAGQITYANEATGEMARALRCDKLEQMLPPNTGTIVSECLAGGKANLRLEMPIGPRVISWSFFPVQHNHTVHCYAGDITQHQQAEEALRQRVKLQDQLVHTAAAVPGMIYSLLMRPDGSTRMPYASGALEEIFDLQPKDVFEDAAPVFSMIHPGDLGHVMATIAESARTLNPWRDDFRVCHTRLGEIWVEGHSMPQREPDGSTLWYGFVQNVTERKRTEERLQQSEGRMRAITDSAQDAILMMDPQGKVSYWNPAAERILGYTNAEAIGQNLHDLIAPAHFHPAHHTAFPAFLQTGQGAAVGKTIDLEARRKDGQELSVQLSLSSVHMKDGWQAVGIIRNITERKQLEAYGEMGREVLQILNEPGGLQDSIQRVIVALKTRADFDAVGIRLQAGDDFPYFAQQGLSKDFLLTENTLVERAADGGVCRDKDGKVRLECTCGLVISGKTDPVSPLFTRGGSFWTNDSFPLLDIPPGEDTRHHPRNQCIHHGYASVALIPIRNQDRIVGLVHFNDRRKGRFTLGAVELLEGIASHIGAALMRKQAVETLHRSETKFRTLYDSTSDAVMLLDPKGFFDCNQATLAMFGCATREEFCSKHAVDVSPSVQPGGTDSLTLASQHIATAMEKGSHRFEWVHKRADTGDTFPAEVLLSALELDGKPVLQATVRDITERKRSEEELRNKEQLLSEAQRLGHIGSWFFDMTAPMRWSEELYRVYGVSPDTFTPAEESLLGLIYPDDRPAMQAWMAACAGGEKPGESEFRIIQPDGTIRWIRGHGDAVYNTENRLTHIAGTAQDITEHKVAETKLAGLQKQLLDASRQAGMAEVATNVLHNVGNVLNSVNISTGLIVESVKKSRTFNLARVVALLQEHAHDLGEFITNDSRGKHLTAHLAQLSKHLLAEQEANVRELDSLRRNVEHIKEIVAMQQNYATFGGVKEMVNVADLVEDSLRLNAGAFNRHEVEVIREFETVPTLNLEKHKFLQVMVNLLRNGKHACQDSERADKRLTVRVAKGEGRIRISVIDNGVGIPPENLTRIFNYGFTTRKEGHGFGLHSGALAAKEMGGSLSVHSEGPGRGATFALELPCPTQEDFHA